MTVVDPTGSWLDVGKEPLHHLVLPPEYTYEELDAELTAVERYYRARVRENPDLFFATLVDVRAIRRSNAKNRSRFTQIGADMKSLLEQNFAAVAGVVSNPVIKGAVTAATWVFPFPCPWATFTDPRAAEGWLREKLAAGPRTR